ncbi:hypothetical protein OA07_23575 [Aphanizomenon flos-aquae 2012/KM1/D3]|nr:hypothetical protein OA07_23575 [Aphanizomenon flos-aquae 2012/KM1/D3]
MLPIPSYLLSTTAQAQTSQDQKTEADKLLEQGNQQFQRSQYKDAIQSWQQALVIYQKLKDRNGEANSLGNLDLGIAYNSLGQYPKAIEFHQQSLAIFREIGDSPEERLRQRNGEANSLGNLPNLLLQFHLDEFPRQNPHLVLRNFQLKKYPKISCGAGRIAR